MRHRSDAAAGRVRLALAVAVGAALAVLMPWLAAPAADTASLLLVTSLALTALVGLHGRAAVRAAAVHTAPRPPTEAHSRVSLAGRVTDAPHHPLRPRAPGLV
jgi:hypothetical protein